MYTYDNSLTTPATATLVAMLLYFLKNSPVMMTELLKTKVRARPSGMP